MPALEYLSSNSLISYPFKDSVAPNQSLDIPKGAFLDALFVTNDKNIKRVYISSISNIDGDINIALSEVNNGDIGSLSFPLSSAISHLANTQTSFFSYSGDGWVIKLIFGDEINFLSSFSGTVEYTADQTEFLSSLIVWYPRKVTSLSFDTYAHDGYTASHILQNIKTYGAGEAVILDNGTNNEFTTDSTHQLYIDVAKGLGTGLWNPCPDGDIVDIYTVNNSSPNSSGALFIAPSDCYSLDLLSANTLNEITSGELKTKTDYSNFSTPIPARNGVAAHTNTFNAISSDMGGHGLVFNNHCSPKCSPENISGFANYLNRSTDALAELYKVVNNPQQTYGIGKINGSAFAENNSTGLINSAHFVVTSFCAYRNGKPTPVGPTCSGGFKKYFHEGRELTITSGAINYVFQIKEVISTHEVILGVTTQSNIAFNDICAALSGNLNNFIVNDYGIKNALNDAITRSNAAAANKNQPYATLNYGTLEAYNADKQYGTFITSVIVIYNPSPAAISYSVSAFTSDQATLVPSSVKIKNSIGDISYGASVGTIACKDYNIFESIYFIPCSQDIDHLNTGKVTFEITNTSTPSNTPINYYSNGVLIDAVQTPMTIPEPGATITAAYCVSVNNTQDVISVNYGVPFSYPINMPEATEFTVTGTPPSWITIDTSSNSPRIYSSNPNGNTSEVYSFTVFGKSGSLYYFLQLTIDYFAPPVINYPTQNEVINIYPPDGGPQVLTTRTFTKSAPLIPIAASNYPTSYSITLDNNLSGVSIGPTGTNNLPPGLSVGGNGLIGKLKMPSNTVYPAFYPLTLVAHNSAGSSSPVHVLLEINETGIATSYAKQGEQFNYSIIVGPEVISQTVEQILPDWLLFDPTLNHSSAGAVPNFYGTNYDTTSTEINIVVKQQLYGGSYRLVSYTIPYIVTPIINYPTNSTVINLYPPDFKNPIGSNTQFTSVNPLFTVSALGATSFNDNNGTLPLGLSIDNNGNITGQISDDASLGLHVVTINAVNAVGTTSVTFNINLSQEISEIIADYGTGFCYTFSDLSSLGASLNVSFSILNLPSFLNISSQANSSCHIYSSGILNQTNEIQQYITLSINNAGLITNRFFNFIYSPSLQITYPAQDQLFYIVYSGGYSTITFNADAPLLQILTARPISFYLASGLPRGLSITQDGKVIGAANDVEGTYNVQVIAGTSSGARYISSFKIYISSSPLNGGVFLNTPYCYKISGLGQADSYGYTGPLPPGLHFTGATGATCNIYGTVSGLTHAANYPLTLFANKGSTQMPLSLNLNYLPNSPTPQITTPLSQNIYYINPPDYNNREYTTDSPLFSVYATQNPILFSAVGLPPSLSIVPESGQIVGGPVSQTGTYNVTISVESEYGYYGTGTCSIVVSDTADQSIVMLENHTVCKKITSADNAIFYNISGTWPDGVSYNGFPGFNCNFTGTPASTNSSGVFSVVIENQYLGGASNNQYDIQYWGLPSITGISTNQTYESYTGATGNTGPSYNFLPSVYLGPGEYTDDNPLLSLSVTNDPTSIEITSITPRHFTSLHFNPNGNLVGYPSYDDINLHYTISARVSNPAGSSNIFTFVLSFSAVHATIDWPTPDTMVYGQRLNEFQLNATTQASGNITYSPPAGYLPPIGVDTLTAYYNPTSLDYLPTQKTNQVTVLSNLIYGLFPDVTVDFYPASNINPPIYNFYPSFVLYKQFSDLSPLALVSSANPTTKFAIAGFTAGTGPTGASQSNLGYFGVTSNTTIQVGTGTRTFTVNTIGSFAAGDSVMVTNTGGINLSYMIGTISAIYSGNRMTISVSSVGGNGGTFSSWEISLYSTTFPGPTGSSGSSGPAWPDLPITLTPPYYPGLPPLLTIDNSGALIGTVLPNMLNKSYGLSITAVDSLGNQSPPYNCILAFEPRKSHVFWDTPDPIIYGTPLTDQQLNASFDIYTEGGVLLYNYQLGDVLNVGTNILTAEYVSSDINVAGSTKSVSLVITPNLITGLSSDQTFESSTGATGGSGPSYNILPSVYLNSSYTEDNPLFTVNTLISLADYHNFGGYIFTATGLPNSLTITNTGKIVGSYPQISEINQTYNVTINLVNTVVYYPQSGAHYNDPPPFNFTLSIQPIPTNITWPALDPVVYGTPITEVQLNATADVAGSFTYTPDYGTVFNVGNNTITAVFTPDSEDYGSATVTNNLTVLINKITSFTPASFLNSYYSAATGPSGPVYSPNPSEYLNNGPYTGGNPLFSFGAASTVYTYSATGLPSSLTVGGLGNIIGTPSTQDLNKVYYISLYAQGNDNYQNNRPRSFYLKSPPYNFVLDLTPKNHPVLTWSSPNPITYGTPLSTDQLNASSNVDGTFTYSPASGTVLNHIHNTLNTVFTPTSVDYYTAEASVNINVNPAGGPIAITGISTTQAIYQSHTGSTGSTGTYYNFLPSVYLAAGPYTDNNPLLTVNTDVLASGFIAQGLPNTLSINTNGNIIGTPVASQLNAIYNVTVYANNNGTLSSAFHFVLSIQKGIPQLNWDNPADIVYKTQLIPGAQLNATTDVLGKYVYDPVPGTILMVGTNIPLHVTFTPNSSDFIPVTKTVHINVVPATTNLVTITGVAVNIPVLSQTSQVSYVKPPGLNYSFPVYVNVYTIMPSVYLNSGPYTDDNPLISITTDNPPFGFQAIGLPEGLSISANGNIVGNPSSNDIDRLFSISISPDNLVYSAQVIYITLGIPKQDPVITWPQITHVGVPWFTGAYGATASVPGTFIYAPDYAEYDYGGSYTWSATFYPSNSTDYNIIPATTTLQLIGRNY